jgi:peptidoglycan/xylan/chitin deacetylase (PgdA/CDA1 family)
MPNSKREKLVQLLDGIGLNRVLALAARRPGLLTLAYHRIGKCADQPFDDELFSATAEKFRSQIRYLHDHFELLSVESLLQTIERGRLALKRPSVLISFDDGYRDSFDVALPILREIGAPAVFFIAAGYIDNPRLTWWDRAAYIVKNTERDVLELDYPVRLSIDLRKVSRSLATKRILRIYKQKPEIDQEHFFDRLETQANVSVDSVALGRDLFVTWDQVREMKRVGMEIGAHAYDHPVLSRIPEDAQRKELAISKERIESEIGGTIRTMAYPVGGPDAFDEVTKRLVQEAGYCAAFSYYGGFNRSDHAELFDIRRNSVERHDSFPMFRFRASTNNLCGRALL